MLDFHSEVTTLGDTIATLRDPSGVEYAVQFQDIEALDNVLSTVLVDRTFVRLDSMTKLEVAI